MTGMTRLQACESPIRKLAACGLADRASYGTRIAQAETDEVVIACPRCRTPARARLRPPQLPAPACRRHCWGRRAVPGRLGRGHQRQGGGRGVEHEAV
jgi:hypothetical protein